ncbi:glyoxylase-like metal-dependent hydrolase (beta-lactamase superfamily II) [Angulomicrobium amanitiforme]|uniref:Glyoxylase-like metal-dependent hydrolase (Beta-lactamase superfamily II) n=2 Tax=Ancylobacter amanitiformis TaxID=217069 RepID=A0ABU0LLB0_9HYPH|nr:glyoxylase-like metal-dependent hydrolase (beta-lactamase superfamily II) [Ancylobacter amanitiformis]
MPEMKVAVVPVTPFQQNCSIVWDETTKRGAVIDPGGDLPRILAALEELEVTAEKIVLTHGHIDHAAGAAELAETLKIPVEGPHEADRFLLDDLPTAGERTGIPGRVVTPDRWLSEGDTVDIGGVGFEILHVPGHTPGHIVLVNRDNRLAIVGDTLFQRSVGRTDFPYGDSALLIEGIKTKILPLGDAFTILPGHGSASNIALEKRTNPFLR